MNEQPPFDELDRLEGGLELVSANFLFAPSLVFGFESLSINCVHNVGAGTGRTFEQRPVVRVDPSKLRS